MAAPLIPSTWATCSSPKKAALACSWNQVLFVPAGRPWLKEGQPLAEASHRVRMVELAVASNPHFRVRLNEVDRPGLTYTVDTLEELRSEVPDGAELYFILGLDAFESFHRWKEPDRILNLCRLVVVSRPGYADEERDRLLARYRDHGDRICLLPVHSVDFSATEIRRRAAPGHLLPLPGARGSGGVYCGPGALPGTGMTH